MNYDSNCPPKIDWGAELDGHASWLRKVVACRVRDRDAVDDVMQNLALAIVASGKRPTSPDKIASWLYRVAVRETINWRRRNGRHRRALEQWVGRQAPHRSDGGEPIDGLIRREQHHQFRRAFQQLRTQDAEILMLKYTEHWTYRQLAERLGTTVEVVEWRLFKARQNLRRILAADADLLEMWPSAMAR